MVTMRENILDVLRQGQTILSDGALGTMLQSYDIPAGTLPELWNAERPDVLRAVHQAYLDAGSQILTTNTFGGNRVRIREAGLAGRGVELTRLGVLLAREVAQDKAWVAGSVGPTGQLMEPLGPLSEDEAADIYAEQTMALAEAGADLILIETQHDIAEATAIIRAAKAHTQLPVFCTFAFNAKGRTMMGLRPGEAAARAEEAGADAVGANCGEGPAAVALAIEQMRQATSLPLIAQANAGIPQMGEHQRAVWDITPEQMAEHVRSYVAAGARVVGGCCGTGPQYIAAIAAALRSV